MFRAMLTFFKLIGYAVLVAITLPLAMVMRSESRPPTMDDGVDYDDNDPGVDVDV